MANLTEIKSAGGSLCFWGEWFGRPYDNFHRIVNFTEDHTALKIYFEGGEILTVTEPYEIINEAKCFEIHDAHEIIWEWNYYGQSISPENHRQIIYTKNTDGTITKKTSDYDKEIILKPKKKIAVQLV